MTILTNEVDMDAILHALQNNDKETFQQYFLALHPSDQVDVFASLEVDERDVLYTFLTNGEFAIVFSGLYFMHQKSCIKKLSNDYAAGVLNEMFTDDTVRFLKRLDEDEAHRLLHMMDPTKAQKIHLILKHDLDTAGAVMTSEFIAINPEATIEEAIEKVKQEETDAEIVYYTYVTDNNGILQGVISLKKLITAPPKDIVKEHMNKHLISIPAHMEHGEVGKVIQKYDLLAVPVVAEHGHLLGIVTVDDVMDIIEVETTKKFGEFSTVKDAAETDISAWQSAKKRAPWIVFLMFAGLVTSGVIGRFEDTLESVVILAAFMPMLMDSGGNVGTQSLAVSVRGLALGTIKMKNMWRMIVRELTTGFLIGFSCMILITILILVLYGNFMLGVVVGISLLITLSISAVIGLIFPLILDKFKFDPAIASGPFITTINDIVGLMIYFSIATMLMNYF